MGPPMEDKDVCLAVRTATQRRRAAVRHSGRKLRSGAWGTPKGEAKTVDKKFRNGFCLRVLSRRASAIGLRPRKRDKKPNAWLPAYRASDGSWSEAWAFESNWVRIPERGGGWRDGGGGPFKTIRAAGGRGRCPCLCGRPASDGKYLPDSALDTVATGIGYLARGLWLRTVVPPSGVWSVSKSSPRQFHESSTGLA